MAWLQDAIGRLRGMQKKRDGVPSKLPPIDSVTRKVEDVRVFNRTKDAFDRGLADTSMHATLGAEKYRGPKYKALMAALGKPSRPYVCEDPSCPFEDLEEYLDEWIVLVPDGQGGVDLGTVYFRRDDPDPDVREGHWNIGARDKSAGKRVKARIAALMRGAKPAKTDSPTKTKSTKAKPRTKAKRGRSKKKTGKTEVSVTMKVPAADAKALRAEIRELKRKYTKR